MANLQRSIVLAVKEETTAGTPVVPSAGTDFIPLKVGASMTAAQEELTNDEIQNNLGQPKSLTGKETPSGTHGIYLKASETAGQAPEYGIMVESCLGAKSTAGAEYDTVAGSTTTVLNVDTGEGASYEVGEAVLVQDGTNGYSIRNVKSISNDALTLNYALANAPASGVNLGQAVLYKPATTSIPTFTAWMYRSSGAAIEMMAGCKTSSMSMTLTAGQQAEAEFSYEGTGYYFNPVVISSSNKYIDLTDDGGTIVITLTEGVYKDPIELATHITTVGTAACAASGGDDFSCTYSSSTGKFTIATTTGTLFSILWKTGTHGADNADDHVGTTLGFSDAADDTGALTYTSDLAINMDPADATNIVTQSALTPTYDGADNVVVKSAELFVGSSSDNTCIKASNLTITVDTPSVDADSICSASGLFEKVASTRTVTLTATTILDQYDAAQFNRFYNNTTTQAMVNIGPKSSGDWVKGKCVNMYLGNCTVTGHAVGGDDFVTLELTLKGFITSSLEDFYFNLI